MFIKATSPITQTIDEKESRKISHRKSYLVFVSIGSPNAHGIGLITHWKRLYRSSIDQKHNFLQQQQHHIYQLLSSYRINAHRPRH
jgi:hypothetical protein